MLYEVSPRITGKEFSSLPHSGHVRGASAPQHRRVTNNGITSRADLIASGIICIMLRIMFPRSNQTKGHRHEPVE